MLDMKKGDPAITTRLRRGQSGLYINISAHPRVETFLQGLVGGATKPVGHFGRFWSSEQELLTYELPDELRGIKTLSPTVGYRFDTPGKALYSVDGNTGMKILNMSFLFLVGTATEGGITFNVSGVYSRPDVIQLSLDIREASSLFYVDYIKPMDINVSVNTSIDIKEG